MIANDPTLHRGALTPPFGVPTMKSDATDRENSFVVRDNQRHAILDSS
jgi:hypothetical protein